MCTPKAVSPSEHQETFVEASERSLELQCLGFSSRLKGLRVLNTGRRCSGALHEQASVVYKLKEGQGFGLTDRASTASSKAVEVLCSGCRLAAPGGDAASAGSKPMDDAGGPKGRRAYVRDGVAVADSMRTLKAPESSSSSWV